MKALSAAAVLAGLCFAACSGKESPVDAPGGASGASSRGGAGVSSGGVAGNTSNASGGRSDTKPNGGVSGLASGGSSLAGSSATSGGGAVNGGVSGGASGGRRATTGGGGAAAGASSEGGRPASAGAAASGATSTGGGSGQAGGASAGAPANDVTVTIKNGGYWNDVAGKRIEAHGGGFIRVENTWYWIGEDKSHNSGNFRAVNCYSSPDLSHWTFANAIITRDTASQLAAADRIIERPKVLYNEKTSRYVMWLHWEGKDYAEAAAGVFSSATVDGDYTFHSSFRPNNNMSRDDTLFKDDDGTAYFISAANENADLIIYELTDDYLDIERQVVTLWKGSYREAPALFKIGTRYFLITSGATGWDPNQAKYATATAIGGPWSALQNLGDGTTYDTQSTYVIPVQGTDATTYVFAGDRWQDPDLASSKYVWLPLIVSGSALTLGYHAEWQLNVTRGTWGVDDGYVAQSGWSVVRVSSEETQDENAGARNAFDDSASTYWHTEWGGDTSPGHPHELVIDLGATYTLEAFRYTPRQDKDEGGMVADYAFYASESSTDFGAAVAEGTFGSTREPTEVSFTPKAARYIRFVALSQINGEKLASVAELDVVGSRL
jgi:hypothetical protein